MRSPEKSVVQPVGSLRFYPSCFYRIQLTGQFSSGCLYKIAADSVNISVTWEGGFFGIYRARRSKVVLELLQMDKCRIHPPAVKLG